MESNLFLSLFKYRPRLGRRPLEDFVTECISYIFQNDIAFLSTYLKFLLGKNILIDKFTVQTQLSVGCGRIDLVITWNENYSLNSLFLEHKVWSSPWEYENDDGIRQDQIDTYCNYQTARTKPGVSHNYVALISNFLVPGYSKEEKKHDAYLGNKTWWDISRLLSDHIKCNNDRNVLVKIEKEFVDFMRRQNMGGLEDFTLAELSSISFFESYEEKRISLLNRIQETFRDKELNKYKLLKYPAWGEGDIGKRFGVIFHDGGENKAYNVGIEASLWFFLGLFTNSDDENFPKSTLSIIPDMFCGIIKWFETSKELSAIFSSLKASQILTGLDPQFKINTYMGDIPYSHYIVISEQESLLNFVQRPNNEIEILAFLMNGYEELIDKKRILNKLIGLQ